MRRRRREEEWSGIAGGGIAKEERERREGGCVQGEPEPQAIKHTRVQRAWGLTCRLRAPSRLGLRVKLGWPGPE